MQSIRNLLPALALVFGATLAMAMNFPGNPTERYAQDPTLPIWYNLTGVIPGSTTYNCDGTTSTCSREDPMSSSSEVEKGVFVKNGNLPEATF